jgi:ABC-type transport system involved in multi-copper enzyme maturation permease subunit
MKTIIKKELLDHLQSIQFSVLVVISIVLFLANGIIFVKKYDEQNSWYNEQIARLYEQPSTMGTTLHAKPNSLLFMAEGGDKYRPSGYQLYPKGRLSAMPGKIRNFKMPDIPELDWAFIIKIIFTLYVLLLGYSSISGEKEQGTLRLILSNSHGRIKFLVSKYIAIILTVSIPMVIGMLISMIILGVSIPQVFSLDNLLRILLMLMLVFAYLSIFAFLSLLVSSLVHQSSLVLLILLAVWILFAIVIPNVPSILSEEFSKVPSEYEIANHVGPMIQKQVWERIENIRKQVQQGEIETEPELKKLTDDAFEQGQQDLSKHYKSYNDAMQQRARMARNLSRISPTALFQFASENIAQTGLVQEEQFEKDAISYSAMYDDYILKKVGKVVGTSPWSFSTNIELNGKSIYIGSPYSEEYQGDKSDFPRFEESQVSIMKSLRNALLDLAGLILWNLILALLAFAAFIRCDIR